MIGPSDVRWIDESELHAFPERDGALDQHGRLLVHPAAWWSRYTRDEIARFGHYHGYYAIPTEELVEWISTRIDGRKAIEIGAGSGVLGEALGITATDSRMQDNPTIRALYSSAYQPTITYGPRVKTFDAWVAVKTLKPRVVVAAWVTHKFVRAQDWRGGNTFGVNFAAILGLADLIFVGNEHTHRNSPLLDWTHEHYTFPWLISRAHTDAPNFVGVWRKGCVK